MKYAQFLTLCCSYNWLQRSEISLRNWLVKKSSNFYRTRNVITMFSRAGHWTLFRARCILSTSPYTISLKCVIILCSRQYDLSRVFFKMEYAFLISPICAKYSISHSCFYRSQRQKLIHKRNEIVEVNNMTGIENSLYYHDFQCTDDGVINLNCWIFGPCLSW